MSQSDYIKYKKVSNMINDLKKMPSIIEEGQYLNFNQYSVENTNINSKMTWNQLSFSSNSNQPSAKYVNIFGIEKNVLNCKNNTYSCPYLGNKVNRVNYMMAKQIGNKPSRPLLINKKPVHNPPISKLPLCECTKY